LRKVCDTLLWPLSLSLLTNFRIFVALPLFNLTQNFTRHLEVWESAAPAGYEVDPDILLERWRAAGASRTANVASALSWTGEEDTTTSSSISTSDHDSPRRQPEQHHGPDPDPASGAAMGLGGGVGVTVEGDETDETGKPIKIAIPPPSISTSSASSRIPLPDTCPPTFANAIRQVNFVDGHVNANIGIGSGAHGGGGSTSTVNSIASSSDSSGSGSGSGSSEGSSTESLPSASPGSSSSSVGSKDDEPSSPASPPCFLRDTPSDWDYPQLTSSPNTCTNCKSELEEKGTHSVGGGLGQAGRRDVDDADKQRPKQPAEPGPDLLSSARFILADTVPGVDWEKFGGVLERLQAKNEGA
jgi:hypothetical protein